MVSALPAAASLRAPRSLECSSWEPAQVPPPAPRSSARGAAETSRATELRLAAMMSAGSVSAAAAPHRVGQKAADSWPFATRRRLRVNRRESFAIHPLVRARLVAPVWVARERDGPASAERVSHAAVSSAVPHPACRLVSRRCMSSIVLSRRRRESSPGLRDKPSSTADSSRSLLVSTLI